MIRSTTTLSLLLALPAALPAQVLHVSPFAARNAGLASAPTLVGLAATAYTGAVGIRASGSMDAPSSPLAPALGYGPSPAVQAWSGDVDLVFSGGRAGLSLGAVEPAIFTGFGVHGLRRADGTTATIPVWSYGVGASTSLTSWLSLDVEGRYRMPHESRADLLPAEVGGGWEVRTGLSLRLGRAAAGARRTSSRASRSGTGARSTGYPTGYPTGGSGRPASGSAAVAALTIRTADRYVGVPYRWGGDSPEEGFDCSGYVQYVYARNGIHLPRVSRDQSRAGEWIPPTVSSLREGDLLFFAGSDGVIDHVAIYVGDSTILHSSASRGAVGYDRLDSRRGSWYATNLVAARRVIGERMTFRLAPGG